MNLFVTQVTTTFVTLALLIVPVAFCVTVQVWFLPSMVAPSRWNVGCFVTETVKFVPWASAVGNANVFALRPDSDRLGAVGERDLAREADDRARHVPRAGRAVDDDRAHVGGPTVPTPPLTLRFWPGGLREGSRW